MRKTRNENQNYTKDIDNAKMDSTTECLIGPALRRQVPDAEVALSFYSTKEAQNVRLPGIVVEAIEQARRDQFNGKKISVLPFEFEL